MIEHTLGVKSQAPLYEGLSPLRKVRDSFLFVYLQVVFEDVADSYPNDSDIVCNLVLSEGLSHVPDTDLVGIFKVPFVEPEAVLASRPAEVTQGSGRGSVTFRVKEVPKEEDFYQFQFLRRSNPQGDNSVSVLGASIPFQLRKPKTEELCAVQQVRQTHLKTLYPFSCSFLRRYLRNHRLSC